MKVLFLCNLVPAKWGAYEAFVGALGAHLRATGDALAVGFAGPPGEDVAVRFRDAGVRWDVIPGWVAADGTVRPWAVLRGGRALLRAEQPDVVAVHFGNELPSLALIVAARLLGRCRARWVWHQRQQIADPAPLARVLSRIRLAALGFDHFVVSYEGGRRSLLLRGIPERRVTVIYNALEDATPARPHGWLREALGVAPDTLIVTNVGWLVKRKRIHLAIAAFAEASAGTSAVLAIVGKGPEREALQAAAEQAGVAERVRFLGQRDDVRDILAESDLLVHTSEAETCTNVVLEAMAAGKPVVMADAGAAREQVDDGASGFVVGVQATTDLAQRLRTVLADPALRARFGREARTRWERLFRLDESVRRHRDCYQALVERGRI